MTVIVNKENGTVTMSIEEFNDMQEDVLFLEILQSNGVDNWSGYSYACDEFNELSEDDIRY